MESAAVDVEMNIATVEIRGAGFPPRMRHSLIYNYLRELGVKMLQNAYKHPCSKHLTTVGKGTHFFSNRDKKTNKKFGITPIFNK